MLPSFSQGIYAQKNRRNERPQSQNQQGRNARSLVWVSQKINMTVEKSNSPLRKNITHTVCVCEYVYLPRQPHQLINSNTRALRLAPGCVKCFIPCFTHMWSCYFLIRRSEMSRNYTQIMVRSMAEVEQQFLGFCTLVQSRNWAWPASYLGSK